MSEKWCRTEGGGCSARKPSNLERYPSTHVRVRDDDRFERVLQAFQLRDETVGEESAAVPDVRSFGRLDQEG
jgi:hypothetical protein